MPLGRIDELTTANVFVRGGTARNVVPEWCELEAEVCQLHDFARVGEVVQQFVDAAPFAAAVSDCTLESRIEPKYRGYRHRPDDLGCASRPTRSRAPASSRASRSPAVQPTRTSSRRGACHA